MRQRANSDLILGVDRKQVVGRAGAGKSSIFQALFRMIEIEDDKDSNIVISGVDIRNLGLKYQEAILKQFLNVPQIKYNS